MVGTSAQPVLHQRSASASSVSSKTNSYATSSDRDAPDLSPNEDSSGFQEGGLGLDGDKVEHELTINQPSTAKGFCFWVFSIICKLTKCVTFKDIPHEVAQQFDYIKVILFDMAGNRDVWVALTNEQLALIWNLLLEDKYPVSTNRHNEDAFTLFSDVKKLVSEIFMVCCTS